MCLKYQILFHNQILFTGKKIGKKKRKKSKFFGEILLPSMLSVNIMKMMKMNVTVTFIIIIIIFHLNQAQ